MTLEHVSQLSSSVAAIALVASLIYAALQFRIHAKSAHETRVIAAAAVFQDFSRLLAGNAECARILRNGLGDLAKLDAVERWRFGSMMQMLIANSQLVLELESVGRQDHFHAQSMRRMMRMPGARQWWDRERKMFASTAAAAVDAILGAPDAPLAEADAVKANEKSDSGG